MKKTMEIIIEPTSKNTYWLKNILSGIKESASKYNHRVRFLTAKQLEAKNEYLTVIGTDLNWIEETTERATKLGLKPVIVNASKTLLKKYNCSGVLFELYSAVENCVKYLLSLSKNKITLVGVNKDSASDTEKVNAFLSIADKFQNVEFNVEYRTGNFTDCLTGYLDKLDRNGNECALCVNDTTAINLIGLCLEKGFILPRDLFVIGMGNSFLGKELSMPLTTVNFDYFELGKSAVFLYHTLIKSPVNCAVTLLLPCNLVIRESTANAWFNPGFSSDALCQKRISTAPDFNDEMCVRKIESVMQETDDVGRDIIVLLAKGLSSSEIAEKLFFTERGIRYRVKDIASKLGCNTKEDLVKLLRKVL